MKTDRPAQWFRCLASTNLRAPEKAEAVGPRAPRAAAAAEVVGDEAVGARLPCAVRGDGGAGMNRALESIPDSPNRTEQPPTHPYLPGPEDVDAAPVDDVLQPAHAPQQVLVVLVGRQRDFRHVFRPLRLERHAHRAPVLWSVSALCEHTGWSVVNDPTLYSCKQNLPLNHVLERRHGHPPAQHAAHPPPPLLTLAALCRWLWVEEGLPLVERLPEGQRPVRAHELVEVPPVGCLECVGLVRWEVGEKGQRQA